MKILVINCGSSSIKAELIDTKSKKTESRLAAERINDIAQISLNGKHIDCNESGHEAVLKIIFELFKNEKINGVGHRVVHGGDIYDRATLINDAVIEDIEQLSPLAPLHNPMNLLGIRESIKAFPKLVQIAVFDTSFHQTMPRRARTYALPEDLRKKHKLRRFGFHGPSHKYVAKVAAAELKQNWRELRLITCHLGNGASVCAVEYGRSVET
ncbi:MAG TPA: acetate/propionate family kinase, partial [Bacteroidetes bacterium]|nr:acetate/propionate family kinase [Bacteroidota bacterium]